jgi:hypothetical protein
LELEYERIYSEKEIRLNVESAPLPSFPHVHTQIMKKHESQWI